MAEGLYQLQSEQFTSNLQLRLQQQNSILRGKVAEGQHVGKQAAIIDYAKPVAMQAPAGMYALAKRTDTDYMRRWVTPVPRELFQEVDTFQKLLTVEDPTSTLVKLGGAAVAREWDDRVISAAFATVLMSSTDGTVTAQETWAQAQSGLTGSTTGLTISNRFANGTTSIGMTTDKLIEAKRLFRHYHVLSEEMQPGDLTMIIGSQQEADMLKLVELTSSEFNSKRILEKGSIDGESFMGWNFHVSERLSYGNDPVSGDSNCRQCIAFVRSGLYLGVWLDTENVITRENLLSGSPWLIHTMMSSGATRLEPGRLLQVSCGLDTAGGDNI